MKRMNPPAPLNGGQSFNNTMNTSSSTSKLDSLASRAIRRMLGPANVGANAATTPTSAAASAAVAVTQGLTITPNQIAVFASIFYSAMSISMILANKLILSTYAFDYPNVLLLLQCVMSLGMVALGSYLGLITQVDRIEKDKLLQWLPVNVFFLVMLLSGFYSLKYMSVPMFMVFKNTNNVLVTIGDWFLFDQPVTGLIIWSLILLIIATLLSAKEDLEYTYEGYIWTAVNMVSSTGYLLYLRYAMTRTRLSQIGMVVHNNFLSVPLILVVDYLTKQDIPQFTQVAMTTSQMFDMPFTMLFLFNGVVGSLLSLASFFCVQATSPTTFSMVGALNKIPMAFLGVYMFGAKMTLLGACYVGLSMISGALYAVAKVRQQKIDNAAATATAAADDDGADETSPKRSLKIAADIDNGIDEENQLLRRSIGSIEDK